jgi:hypothetical protein
MKKNHLMIMVCILAVGLISGCSKTFNKTFGVPGEEDVAYSVQQTKDGGYILAGYTNSFGAGFYDAWLIKTNANGNKVWDKTFGGIGYDVANAVQQTSDGGYILAGETYSFGAGDEDAWLIKTDANGNKVWDKTFGGIGYDVANAVQQTSDGGYILAGYTVSFGAGSDDAWLIKTDASGETCDYSVGGNCYENESKWVKTFGGLDIDTVCSVQQTSDGGYILAGYTASFGAGFYDAWLIKTDASGETCDYSVGGNCYENESKWVKTFGGSGDDQAYSVQQTKDGGYILAGRTDSAGSDDAWLIKTDASGETCDYSGGGNCYENESKWVKTFGGTSDDGASSVQQTKDGGYILAGYTESFGAGWVDAWLIKTDENGVEQWNKTFGGSGLDWAYSVQQTKDGGYILAGSYGAGYSDAWLIKTDAKGNAPPTPTP